MILDVSISMHFHNFNMHFLLIVPQLMNLWKHCTFNFTFFLNSLFKVICCFWRVYQILLWDKAIHNFWRVNFQFGLNSRVFLLRQLLYSHSRNNLGACFEKGWFEQSSVKIKHVFGEIIGKLLEINWSVVVSSNLARVDTNSCIFFQKSAKWTGREGSLQCSEPVFSVCPSGKDKIALISVPMCGSCHIWNVLIAVKYWNCCQTFDVYILFAIWMGPIRSKLIY